MHVHAHGLAPTPDSAATPTFRTCLLDPEVITTPQSDCGVDHESLSLV
ncbi:MAG: hypothetical protein ACOCWR_00955 [Oceanidesulfovibrio sp.]